MTTGPKKGLYWYIALTLVAVLTPSSFVSLVAIKQQLFAGEFWQHWKEMINCMVLLAFHAIFISDVLKYKEGYTIITTTQYKLFKCRKSGEEEAFMMFADSEEELERFFQLTQPNAKFFIETAEMTGKSIQMKVFNAEYENSGIHSKS